MIRRDNGFTLIEVLITMGIFIIIVSGIVISFMGLLNQYKQQSRMAETNIEGIIGLEILRRDIEHAGYGLPWNIPSTLIYTESSSASYNSVVKDAAPTPPRALVNINGTNASGLIGGSDILVIKSLNVATDDTAQKWATVKNSLPTVTTWITSGVSENLADSDKVIVVNPGGSDVSSLRSLQNGGGSSYYTTVATVKSSTSWQPSLSDSFTDASGNVVSPTWIAYGLTPPDVTPERPYNRADYFIGTTAGTIPTRCAAGTGVLYKALLNHGGGYQYLPLLDCVADMQILFELDTNGDGIADTESNDISGLTAKQIRDQVKEVRVYILAQEGQRDTGYSNSKNSISLGGAQGRLFNLTTITNYQNYHWKVYTLSVKPNNLEW